jgi:hypothetical protein
VKLGPIIIVILQAIPDDVSTIFQVSVEPATKKLYPDAKYAGVVVMVNGEESVTPPIPLYEYTLLP